MGVGGMILAKHLWGSMLALGWRLSRHGGWSPWWLLGRQFHCGVLSKSLMPQKGWMDEEERRWSKSLLIYFPWFSDSANTHTLIISVSVVWKQKLSKSAKCVCKMEVDLCALSIYSISSFRGFSLQLIMKIVFNILMVFHCMRIVWGLFCIFAGIIWIRWRILM